jgi:hypothetical protein
MVTFITIVPTPLAGEFSRWRPCNVGIRSQVISTASRLLRSKFPHHTPSSSQTPQHHSKPLNNCSAAPRGYLRVSCGYGFDTIVIEQNKVVVSKEVRVRKKGECEEKHFSGCTAIPYRKLFSDEKIVRLE